MIEPLIKALEAGLSGSLLLEAAAEIGDPRVYPALVRLREGWDDEKGKPEMCDPSWEEDAPEAVCDVSAEQILLSSQGKG
ncbi:MAG TPA: hypothetical protein VKR06_38620 [Ktedonosporobacter sp.]|nr:hypothetical protein [Ktedonosporobacter sp.]